MLLIAVLRGHVARSCEVTEQAEQLGKGGEDQVTCQLCYRKRCGHLGAGCDMSPWSRREVYGNKV